jgi:hypothetical protein
VVPQLESLHCHGTQASGRPHPQRKSHAGGPGAQMWHRGTGLDRGHSTQPDAACGRGRRSSPTQPAQPPVGCWLRRNEAS